MDTCNCGKRVAVPREVSDPGHHVQNRAEDGKYEAARKQIKREKMLFLGIVEREYGERFQKQGGEVVCGGLEGLNTCISSFNKTQIYWI